MTACLPTFIIVSDLESERFVRLQVRIETGRVSAACGQIHTRLFKETFRHGMKG